MGWNTLNVARPHKLIDGLTLGPQGRHAYFVHSYQLKPAQRADLVAEADYGGAVTAIVGARQYRRHAIPSREEPKARSGADREFFAVEAVILFPAIDLKDGEAVRLRAGRHGARDRVQPRSGGAGARFSRSKASNICTSSISTALLPASR